ncbi:Alkaline ceramidase [Papilio xuthus]|uniref:Alkaline ceramidase n=1 Tax=Papilio xuthus TaxID=66420 RepID=A0A0N1IAQ2_PAPXU|nr:Alkaline ceramidase [Papilio xuthus]
MWSHLERGSSPVDWCESNYSISPVIAEFFNTVTNIIFFLFPPVLIHLFQEYSKFVNPAINVLWVLLMVVGLSSAYFHATLSLVGQLLDELAILWVFMAAFAMFFPKRYFPKFMGGNRALLYRIGPVSIVYGIILVWERLAGLYASSVCNNIKAEYDCIHTN